MKYAPIALFCYRRKDVLIKTIEALKNNEQSKDSLLFIFSDGYKGDNDKAGVEEVRNYIKTINGFKGIEIIESPTNKGLANSIIDGVTKIVNEYDKIIVVEDDILTSPYFLKYMNDSLELYANEDDVGCISAYNYPIKSKNETFFIKGGACWGWATWKRSWNLFEKDGEKLLKEIEARKIEKEFNFQNSYPYCEMLKNQIMGKNDSWAIRWHASLFLNNKLCLYPKKTLVQNIGFGIEGSTHCSEQSNYLNDMLSNKIKLSKKKQAIKQNKRELARIISFLMEARTGKKNGNFLFRKIKEGNKRKIIILGFIKFGYKKKNK